MILSNNFLRSSIVAKFYVMLFAIFFSLISLLGAQAHEYKIGTIEIIHPWSRATAPQAKVAGGYFKIINNGDKADKLLKVTTSLSNNVQIHEMAVIDNVMKMRHLTNGIEIPAKGTIEFKPGSFHIMFMDLKNGLKKDKKFNATLFFEKAGKIEVNFVVEAMDKKSMDSDKNMMDKSKPAKNHQH